MPKAATSSLLLLFTQGQPKTLSTAYSYHTGGESINSTVQWVGWISFAIMCTFMTNSIKFRMEWVRRKADLCEKRLKRLT